MSDYTYRENIYDFDGNAIGCKKYTVPNRIVEQIRADAIDEILQIIHNIYSHNLHCMADMCEREEKGYDCEDCMYTAIKNNLEKLKEKKDV